jgi:hypothetical protein
LLALKGKSSFDDWWNVMKRLKVGKCLSYLERGNRGSNWGKAQQMSKVDVGGQR